VRCSDVLSAYFEGDNSRTRVLQSIQALHISLTLGCWSGNRRGMELAEAMRCTILSMFRRSSYFSKSGYRNLPVVRREGTDEEWREWIKEETMKRLVYLHVMMECQMGLFYDVSACISHAELSLPLPFSEKLWRCASSREWANRWNAEIQAGTLAQGVP
jgi:hypothetical protein